MTALAAGPVQDALVDVARFVPKLILFVIILALGWLAARLLRAGASRLLRRVGFDQAVERGGIGRFLGNTRYDARGIVTTLVYYAVLLVTLQLAFGVWGPNPVSALIAGILAWLPKAFAAMLIIVVTAAIAAGVRKVVTAVLGALSYGRLLANVAASFIIGIGVIAALDEIGVASSVTTPILIAILATAGGILVVGVGGGLVRPMQIRWETWLNRAEQEVPQVRERLRVAAEEREAARREAAEREAREAAEREAAARREAEERAAREAAEREAAARREAEERAAREAAEAEARAVAEREEAARREAEAQRARQAELQQAARDEAARIEAQREAAAQQDAARTEAARQEVTQREAATQAEAAAGAEAVTRAEPAVAEEAVGVAAPGAETAGQASADEAAAPVAAAEAEVAPVAAAEAEVAPVEAAAGQAAPKKRTARPKTARERAEQAAAERAAKAAGTLPQVPASDDPTVAIDVTGLRGAEADSEETQRITVPVGDDPERTQVIALPEQPEQPEQPAKPSTTRRRRPQGGGTGK